MKVEAPLLARVSHELRSPLARIQAAVGLLERRVHGREAGYVADIQEDVLHLSAVVGELLTFAEAELCGAGLVRTPTAVADAVERAVSAQAADVEITVDVSAGPRVLAHPEYLYRALTNAIGNAVRHAGTAGPIAVSARTAGEDVAIDVRNGGPILSAEALDGLFEPFARDEEARDRRFRLSGLGLTVARSCIAACGGEVEARNGDPSGLVVTIRLAAAR